MGAASSGRTTASSDSSCRELGANEAVELTSPHHRREPVAPTFHGRDVFAPAAAHLAAGAAWAIWARPFRSTGSWQPIWPRPAWPRGASKRWWSGSTASATSRPAAVGSDLTAAGLVHGDALAVTTGEVTMRAPLARVFADVAYGEVLVHVDGHGHVAVAVNGASASRLLGVTSGSWIAVTRQR